MAQCDRQAQSANENEYFFTTVQKYENLLHVDVY